MAKELYSEADKAIWFTICVHFAAESLDIPVKKLARLLGEYGIADWLLSGYGSFHTQGYEYMAELISDRIRQVQEVR